MSVDAECTTATVSAEVVALVTSYLDDLARRVHDRLGDVTGVAVTMAVDDGGPVTAGTSTATARDIDAVQFAIGLGPCLDALRDGRALYVPDLAVEVERWGPYGAKAAALGARSCQSVPVLIDDAVVAVVKVYVDRIDGLEPSRREVAARAAAEAAGGIELARRLASTATDLDDRVRAMDSRHTIDLAVGIVMERTSCPPQQAFDLLRRQSQHRNVKLREVARTVVETVAGPLADPSAPFLLRGETV